MSIECKVEKTTRQVIEKHLLVSLEDKTKVALLIGKKDLDLLIWALDSYEGMSRNKAREFSRDLSQLKKEAFS